MDKKPSEKNLKNETEEITESETKSETLPTTEKEAEENKWFKETSVPFVDTDGKLKNLWHKGSQYCFVETSKQ